MEKSCNSDIESLVLLCKAGDEAAFEELIRIYEPMIMKTARDLTLDVREVYSDACLSIRRAAESFDTERKVTFGLYAKICVTRTMLDFAKRDKVKLSDVDFDVENVPVIDGVQRRLEREEERRALENQAKALLSELEYKVFLGCLHGDKTSEIAKNLGIDAKSVDNAKARMFKRLRAGLASSPKK